MKHGQFSSLVIALLALTPGVWAQTTPKTPPASLSITPNAVQVEDATYNFDVTLSDLKAVRGAMYIKVVTTVVRSTPTGNARFKDIAVLVAADATTVRLQVDGRQFAIEAGYRDPYDASENPRLVPTTFGQMFSGGKVGMFVKSLD